MTVPPLVTQPVPGSTPVPALPTLAPAGFPVGKVLIAAVAILAPVGAFSADWGATHLQNPNWPPHAKFHNAQTIVSAIPFAALSLWHLWGQRPADRVALRWGTLFAALYYLTQAAAILFPGTALFDPEFADEQPRVAGITLNVLIGQAVLLYPLLAAGYALESRRLRRADR